MIVCVPPVCLFCPLCAFDLYAEHEFSALPFCTACVGFLHKDLVINMERSPTPGSPRSGQMSSAHILVVDDLVMIDDVSEQGILQTLQKRYETERIYVCDSPMPHRMQLILCTQTFIGPVLVSLNPYKQLNIYSPTHIRDYRGTSDLQFVIGSDAIACNSSEIKGQSVFALVTPKTRLSMFFTR